ncbi:MAG: hypothetical protein JG781_1413 [Peptococcaceae bacterium]|jgi:predicted AlkP superfamily phosphohydrolase/phosphomutase|nr:hypothetical protein [Peptococcaceae bacterium]
MGCGGRGWGGFPLFGCGGGMFFPEPGRYRRNEEFEDRSSDYRLIKKELQKMYASGMITSGMYDEYLEQLKKGRFTLDDLWELRQSLKERVSSSRDSKVSREDKSVLFENKKMELHKAREETLLILQNLQNAQAELRKKMEQEELLAKEMISTDERAARAHLEKRQDFAEQAADIEVKIQEIHKTLEQLKELETKLETKIAEQKVAAQRQRLNELEDMVNNL